MEAAAAEFTEMADQDLELVERHRYGDSTAFDEVYERYSPMVYNLALRLAGSTEEAEDLCQETFLKIYRHLAGFQGRSSLSTWIYRVALNNCRSRYRRQRRWRTRLLPDSTEQLERLEDGRRGPEERAVARDSVETISAAIVQLPRIFREAVVLRDIESLSYEEIAEVLGLRIGTVRSRIARGRDRLRSLLKEPD